ncbi:MAG TPA: 30S ribosomal protein S20 [Bacteroidota bacterium]
MPRHASAVKRARQNVRRAIRNKAAITRMKTLIRKVRAAKVKDEGMKSLRVVVKYLDEIAAKGLIHRNKAANQKSRLTKFVNAMKAEEKQPVK